MKTLIKIGIGLVVLILLLYFVIPSAVHVERSAFINASAKTIFYQVNILRNWKKWGPWYEKDPDMKSTYEGPERGLGSKHSWDSEHKEVGKGSFIIIGSYPFDSINTKLEFEGMNPGYGHWKFKDTLDSIRVTWAMDMNMGMNPIHKFFGLMMDGMVGPDFEHGLANLKELCENMPKTEIRYIKAQPMYSIKDSTDLQGISSKLATLFGEIMTHIERSGATVTGQPFSIWHKWDPEGLCVLEAGMPVAETGEGSGRVTAGEIPAGSIATASHFGKYEELARVYNAIEDYVRDNRYTVAGAPWEVYVTDPTQEPDTSKWETQIFFPVK
ncbi:MAG: hypothetical protein FVQ77_15760 [Cytophagales bacterium]|nr:hypothetical protein [Cytophagales bacterium]